MTPHHWSNGPRRDDKLLREYTKLAPGYDSDWQRYLTTSLDMTLQAISEPNRPDRRTLDVASGTGLLLERLAEIAPGATLVGIDRVPAMLDVARRRHGADVHLVQGSAQALPFPDQTFDLVVSTSALHYFPAADVALTEMRRVLAPGGQVVITDWCRDYLTIQLLDWLLPLTPEAHVKAYSRHELEQMLEAAGLRMCSVRQGKADWCWGLMTLRCEPA